MRRPCGLLNTPPHFPPIYVMQIQDAEAVRVEAVKSAEAVQSAEYPPHFPPIHVLQIQDATSARAEAVKSAEAVQSAASQAAGRFEQAQRDCQVCVCCRWHQCSWQSRGDDEKINVIGKG